MLPIPRILIVDDHPDHRRILTYHLARIGPLDIREAGDGRQALVALATATPDLIFMNLGLPVLDGWEAIRHIRALAAPLGQVVFVNVGRPQWGKAVDQVDVAQLEDPLGNGELLQPVGAEVGQRRPLG